MLGWRRLPLRTKSWRGSFALGVEIQVLGDARAVSVEGIEVERDALAGSRQIVLVQVEVQQIDVPRRLDGVEHVGLDDRPRDRQRRLLRVVVDVAVARSQELPVLLLEETREQLPGQGSARLDAGFRVAAGERRRLV